MEKNPPTSAAQRPERGNLHDDSNGEPLTQQHIMLQVVTVVALHTSHSLLVCDLAVMLEGRFAMELRD